MNTRQALEETYDFAMRNLARADVKRLEHSSLGFEHIIEMHLRCREDQTMSEGKLNRWLGWMQAAVVSWGVASLDDMKEINRRNA